MKKVILLLVLLFLFVLLNAQTITIHSIGYRSTSGIDNKPQEGITIHVRVNYSTVDMNNIDGPHADTDQNKVWMDKFTELSPSIRSYDSSVKVSIVNWTWQGLGSNKYCWFNIVCPNIDGIKSVQLRFGLYGDGGGL